MIQTIIGWREWVALPELGMPFIKAKADTGARTSALHACRVEADEENGVMVVRFVIHPLQRRTDIETRCTAPLVDERMVSDSGGHREKRYVIRTPVTLGKDTWPIELTLTNRDSMQFRMLLGRTAMSDNCLVNPNASYLLGRPKAAALAAAY
jgi:hypothetical protein